MESLYACAYLMMTGLGSCEYFRCTLEKKAEELPGSPLIKELYEKGGDIRGIYMSLKKYFSGENAGFDKNAFGKALFEGIENIFEAKYYSLQELSYRCCNLYMALPPEIKKEEPFLCLSYLDEPLTWGEAEQSCDILRHAFDFYR